MKIGPSNSSQTKTTLILSNRLTLQDAPGPLAEELKRRLTFDNPRFLENQRMGYWNGNTPAIIELWKRSDSGLIIPRGFTGATAHIIRDN
jgi:hypothetical protein